MRQIRMIYPKFVKELPLSPKLIPQIPARPTLRDVIFGHDDKSYTNKV